MVELNTLIGLPQDFNTNQLSIGKTYSVTKPKERVFPLHIAMLMVTHNWNILGYAVVHSSSNAENSCKLTFEVISLFTSEEQRIYKNKFVEAAKITGEIK